MKRREVFPRNPKPSWEHAGVSLFVQLICSYLFMPVAFMMGIPYDESFIVAELIGTKLFLNEFVAYEKLAMLKNNRLNGVEEIINNERQWISVRTPPKSDFTWRYGIINDVFWCQVRSETISTYALCGFANLSSMGIVIGGMGEYLSQSFGKLKKKKNPHQSDAGFLLFPLKASICPSRRGDVSSLVMRAMLTGTCVSLVNACVAGKKRFVMTGSR